MLLIIFIYSITYILLVIIMKYLFILVKYYLIILSTTLLFSFITYKDIISEKTLSIIQILVMFTTIFILSYILGKKKEKNGYIDGLIFGFLITTISLIINIIFIKKITKYKLIYYLFIIIISTLGSILGINKKTKA